ncbi:acyl-CoA thioesterase [Micropruina sonneratiae]|uniref:acyl-CoA thioesterase n=1 Tax=Micropruina sonneratiae TaxID=2986940 RepID=UPI002227FE9F|nr:acyl-CoA thioesterase [Micropruina sp. KQZ13P-5]MCW3158515.1 acyl-CoA thioesterase [Micropruina sp. KQZ13P-5]
MPKEDPPAHTLSLTVLMTPETANFAGNVHGGHLLKVLDQVAYSCASRYARRYCVTAAIDRVTFRQAVHVGELVTFLASVNYTGRSSLEVGIRVEAEDVLTGVRRHTTSCYFAMVALDADGNPQPVPQLEVTDELGRRRWAEAEQRRALRLAERRAETDDYGLWVMPRIW